MEQRTINTKEMAIIKKTVCDILEINPDDMTESSLFIEEHNADSLRAIEILATLEKQLSIKIAQERLVSMVNLKGVYDVVKEAFDSSK